MALYARDESLTRPKGGGGKLNRSETVTVRLDPKLNYLTELAARTQRRTKSSFIEWAIAHALGAVPLPEVADWNADPVMVHDWSAKLWQVDEADRVMMLALKAPALLTHEEQLIWKLVREWGAFWFGRYSGVGGRWTWNLEEDSLQFDVVRHHWDAIKALAFGESSETSVLPSWVRRKDQPVPAPFDVDLDEDPPF